MKIENIETEEAHNRFKREVHRSFPRIFKNGKLIGGYDELIKYTADVIGNK